MENSYVSSANNLTVNIISIDRSLLQIKKKGSPKIDLCGTPTSAGNHFDVQKLQLSENCFIKNIKKI